MNMAATNPRLTRRTALAAGMAGTVSLAAGEAVPSVPAAETSLARAIEALRIAMVAGDARALERLLDDRLIYMHSSGHSQTKANLLNDLAGKSFFAALTNSEPEIHVVGRTGILSVTVDQVKNLPGGKMRASRIKVLQTWVLSAGDWVLLARCSALIISAQKPPSNPVPGSVACLPQAPS